MSDVDDTSSNSSPPSSNGPSHSTPTTPRPPSKLPTLSRSRSGSRPPPSPSSRLSSSGIPTSSSKDATANHRHSTSSLLSPPQRPSSRSSSRGSIVRSHSPALSLEDPVSIRNQMSTLKHSIRQQQAQLNNLESIVRSSNILSELNDSVSSSTSSSILTNGNNLSSSVRSNSSNDGTPPSSFRTSLSESVSSSSPSAIKIKRRTSYDPSQDMGEPESTLPLPRRLEGTFSSTDADNIIKEGVPFSTSPSSPPTHHKRNSSTLSRIPISAVGNARALADEGQGVVSRTSIYSSKLAPIDGESNPTSPSLSSPSKRLSFTPGNTTKVLADLQTGVVNARNALENTKSQLRISQRTVSQLTRQVEDHKESRERLRLENEGLNNVVARKERLLQETLERARTAEAEAASLKQQLKTETTTSKKSLREMEAALAESTALSSKSEREYITLKDSLKHLTESWKLDMDRLREEMKRREDKVKADAEKVGKQYRQLLEEVKKKEKEKKAIIELKQEDEAKAKEVEKHWFDLLEKMKKEVEESNAKTEVAIKTAAVLQEELARLRRLMRSVPVIKDPEDDDTPDS